jgi:hypothetical protein
MTKHEPLPGHDRGQTIQDTSNGGDSRYYPGVDIEAVERRAAEQGVDVPSGKPATRYRVMELEEPVGASCGMESRWVRVESTNGDLHGHPITEQRYAKYLSKVKQ